MIGGASIGIAAGIVSIGKAALSDAVSFSQYIGMGMNKGLLLEQYGLCALISQEK